MGSSTPDDRDRAVDDGTVGHSDDYSRKRWWKDGGTVVPIVISIVALAVSGLSYWDQHQSSEAIAVSQQRSAARLITPYVNDDGSKLEVQNLSTTEVTYLYAVVGFIYWPHGESQDSAFEVPVYFFTASLPPCSSITALLDSNTIRKDLEGTSYYHPKGTYTADPQKLIFEDSNQAYWEKLIQDDSLTEIDRNQAFLDHGTGVIDTMSANWEPGIIANNCG
jgi:hypothetical protein